MSTCNSVPLPLIGITGATGQLGRLVVSQLVNRVPPSSIVALVRSPDKAKDLFVSIAIREADYTKPITLFQALQGIDTLLLISSNDPSPSENVAQHTNVINAAKKAGIKHLVYTSLLRANTSPLDWAKPYAETELVLKNSGIPYTMLRNGTYNENYVDSIHAALHTGVWVGASGDGKISGAARRDYAEAAVAILTNPHEHVNATYELAGDDSFTLTAAAAELSKQTGKTIPYRDLSQDEYASVLIKAGLPEVFARLTAQGEFASRNHTMYDHSHTLSKLIGRPTTTIATTISQAIKP